MIYCVQNFGKLSSFLLILTFVFWNGIRKSFEERAVNWWNTNNLTSITINDIMDYVSKHCDSEASNQYRLQHS